MVLRSMGRKVRRFAVLATAALIVSLAALAGCSGEGSNKEAGSTNGGGANMAVSDQSALLTTSNDSAKSESGAQTSGSSAEQPAAASAGFGANAQNTGANGEQDTLNRKIVYHANITMQVEEYSKSQTALQNLIHLSDGYMLQFSDQKTGSELGGTFTIKIPASGFTGFLAELEKIAHLDYQSSVKGTDVTEEFVDLESRLKARQVVEARLLAFMEKATRADDLLKFSQQLGDVQTEIERIKGRMRYLNQNVAYSTIELRLYQVLESALAVNKKQTAFGIRLSEALTGSTEALYRMLQGFIVFIAGALPFAVVLAVVGIPVYYGLRRRRARSAAGYGTAPPVPMRTEAQARLEEETDPDKGSPNS